MMISCRYGGGMFQTVCAVIVSVEFVCGVLAVLWAGFYLSTSRDAAVATIMLVLTIVFVVVLLQAYGKLDDVCMFIWNGFLGLLDT